MTIELTESQAAAAATLARENGFDTPEDYLRNVIDQHLESEAEAGEPLRSFDVVDRTDLEAKLLAGLNSGPGIEVTQDYWSGMLRRVEERHVARNGDRP